MSQDYSTLPPPQIIEDVSYDDLLQETIALFKSLAPEYSDLLESDPIQKVLEAVAYREFVVRQRLNESAEANLLAFAGGSDLDHLGAFYGVTRVLIQEADSATVPPTPEITETDDDFRQRISDRIRGWSTAGGAYHYRYWVREAVPEIADISVDSPVGGLVRLVIMADTDDGYPSDELIEKVKSVAEQEDVKMLTDTIHVEKAKQHIVDIHATVYLLTGTPKAVYDNLAEDFATRFKTDLQKLGRGVTLSWINRQLSPDGVYEVVLHSPTTNLNLSAVDFPSLGNLNIAFGGWRD